MLGRGKGDSLCEWECGIQYMSRWRWKTERTSYMVVGLDVREDVILEVSSEHVVNWLLEKPLSN